MKTELYVIDCKSNLHVGLGDSNYGVIDKLVQKDVTDELPCIYSSSLKGGFREFFEEVIEKEDTTKKGLADKVFGEGENKKSKGMDKGAYIFQQANLLSIPLRSNQKPYYNAISPFIIKQLLKMAELMKYKFSDELNKELEDIKKIGFTNKKPIVLQESQGLVIEDFEDFDVKSELKLTEFKKIVGEDIVLLSTEDMKRMTDDYHLPVIARNKLDNGQSKNLWYEQIVPREAKFTTFVTFNPGTKLNSDEFKTNVDKKVVQFGGDSSIGYGYCKVCTI